MSEWKTYTLGKDVVTKLGDGLHGTPIYDDNGEYYFINGSNLVDGKIVINSNTKKVTEEEFVKYKKDLSDKTILLGINGTIGNVALYNNEMCILGKSAAYLNINDDFDKNFVKYVLTNDHFQNYIKNNASGTTIKNVGLGLLREYQFSAPEAKEQQQEIAQILTSLDDKIELNIQMNQTLEAMAQALFKEWFVNFNFPNFNGELENGLPKGWKNEPMDENIEFLNGLALQKFPPLNEDEFLPVIKIRELKQGFTNAFDKASTELPEKYVIYDGDILFSWSGSLEVVLWCEGKGALNQHLFKVSSNVYPKWFYFFWVREYLPLYKSIAEGKATTMGHIQRRHLTDTIINVPNKELMILADSILSPILDKIQENKIQIQSLTQTRDTLLPKLMRGKLEIRN
jgi:type I restriction enzyme, S subunit